MLLDDGQIRTDLHCKPTDTHQYLQWNSCHPRHCKTSISYSQALRLRRICSQEVDFGWRTGELKQHLQRRGYQEHKLETAVQQAATRRREDCLQPREKERDNTRTPLIVTYHPSLPLLGNITRQHQHLLQLSERMKKAVPAPPIIAYRRPKNLRDLLTRTELKPPPQLVPRNEPCGRPRCKTCPTLMATDKFTSKTSGKIYNMRSSATCKTGNLIYLIQCKKCGCQYVDETEQALNERMNSHRTDIRHKKTGEPVSAHFNSRDHTMDDVQVMVIERIWRNDTVLRKIRENRWIATLDTSWPKGMTLRTDSL